MTTIVLGWRSCSPSWRCRLREPSSTAGALRIDIAKSWSNIDILLKQRHDELSIRLLDVCKGYMSFEGVIPVQKITQARSMFQQQATVDQKAQADQSMTTALRGSSLSPKIIPT